MRDGVVLAAKRRQIAWVVTGGKGKSLRVMNHLRQFSFPLLQKFAKLPVYIDAFLPELQQFFFDAIVQLQHVRPVHVHRFFLVLRFK